MQESIYLDNNATTKPLAEVVDAMTAALTDSFGNPSSVHQFGQAARHLVEVARAQVAGLIGADSKEVVFTSGGTESINLAIRGTLGAIEGRPDSSACRVVTTAVEHTATLRFAELLASEGFDVQTVGVDGRGQIDEAEWSEAIGDHTALVSLQHVNNETGVISDVPRLAKIASDRGAIVHVDAVQSVGKLPIAIHDWPVHLCSMAAHKFHGPKGVGALYVRRRVRLKPVLLGGHQERDLRGGTENVAAIVGMGVAAESASAALCSPAGSQFVGASRSAGASQSAGEGLGNVARTVGALRDVLEAGIVDVVPYAEVIARDAPRIYNTSNIAFAGLQAEAILILLSEAGIFASSGAACSSGSLEPSHVLRAMGIPERAAHGSIRFSLSRFTTAAQIQHVIATVPQLLAKLEAVSRV